ncbi:MAG TPA: hypothetical protein VH350_19455 [Candidatus Sulfotelmatobacter sp.]|nr:hypothetical protein [Candidatus Sulfotelmatobacter sp.]
MTLRALLLILLSCVVPALPVVGGDQSAPPSAAANAEGTASQDATQSSPSTSPPQAAPATPAKKPSDQNATKTTKRRPKKKTASSNCGSASATASNSGSATAPSSTASPSTNCPPAKVIVRQGGTSDNSIQLAGAGPGTSANQKDTANQMLAATESNLKKISAQQLSSDQQQMVSQIRQFMEQSKAAVGDGDLERARTLAWKAQVLSEELVKPAQ